MDQTRKIMHRMLTEDLPPSEEEASGTYYHGTPREANAKSIMQNGIRGRETQGRSFLSPRAGFVYLPKDLKDALPYVIGGAIAGHDTPNSFIENDGRYGYLFVVRGSDLVDIEPDEDYVGKLVYDLLNKENLTSSEFNFLRWAERNLTSRQLQNIKYGEYVYWASGGKRLLKRMPDSFLRFVLDRVSVVAHRGNVMPSEAWRFDKLKTKELQRGGSNFFDLAEKVWDR